MYPHWKLVGSRQRSEVSEGMMRRKKGRRGGSHCWGHCLWWETPSFSRERALPLKWPMVSTLSWHSLAEWRRLSGHLVCPQADPAVTLAPQEKGQLWEGLHSRNASQHKVLSKIPLDIGNALSVLPAPPSTIPAALTLLSLPFSRARSLTKEAVCNAIWLIKRKH